MSIKSFHISTCENKLRAEQPLVFEPPSENPFDPFPIQDPFGLRKAIVPVFKRERSGAICGMGTAFHVDGWGTFLTADHVIDFSREHPKSASSCFDVSPNSNGDHIVLFLGMGLIMGTVGIPSEALSLVTNVFSPMREQENPLANRYEPRNLADIATLITTVPSEVSQVPRPHFVPVRASGTSPSIGETVLAVGFPELNCQPLDEEEQKSLMIEGMYGAYGRITNVYPNGRSDSDLAPVIEVESNWRHGMSGGPIFNSQGEVIGVVSRSMSFCSDTDNDIGFATSFAFMPYFGKLVPTLDVLNPTYRRGWAVFRDKPWHLQGFFKTESEARKRREFIGSDYEVKYGINKFGTDDFGY